MPPLLKRILSALILIPLTLGIVHYGSYELFALLIGLLVVGGSVEYSNIIENTGIVIYKRLGLVLALLFATCCFLDQYYLAWVPLAFLTLFIAWHREGQNFQMGLDSIAHTCLGALYTGGLMGSFLLLRQIPDGNLWIYFAFLIVWPADTLAYFGGRLFGKTPLAPKISPNKTIEGAIFGLMGSLIGASISKWMFLQSLSWTQCLLAALFCGMIAQLGDLYESMLKRIAGVKDSGDLIPGHGGVLDRLDSLMFAGPALYWFYNFFCKLPEIP